MKKNRLFIYCLVFFVALLIFSCVREEIQNPLSETSQVEDFSLSQAKSYFDNLGIHLKSVEFSGSDSERYTEPATRQRSSDLLIPLWDNAIAGATADDRSSVQHIPLSTNTELSGILVDIKDGESVYQNVKVESYLVIERFVKHGHLRHFVCTVIGKVSGEVENDANPYLYTGIRKNFSGFMIISDADGKVLQVFYYQNGYRQTVEVAHMSALSEEREERQNTTGFVFYKKAAPIQVRSGIVGDGILDPGEIWCSQCDIDVIDLFGYCSNCGISLDPIIIIGNCITCNQQPSFCDCPRCAYCDMKEANCTCMACIYCYKKGSFCECEICNLCHNKEPACMCFCPNCWVHIRHCSCIPCPICGSKQCMLCHYCHNSYCNGSDCQIPPPPPPPTPLPNVSLKDNSKAWRWGQGNPPINECLEYCKKTMDEYGFGYGSSANIYRLFEEFTNQSGDTEWRRWGNNPTQNYQNAIDCINNHLDNNRPIIVGIDYQRTSKGSDGNWLNEGTTDHFVVVYGREYNSSTGNYEYLYYDNGVGDINSCCSDTNRLIYDPSGPNFYDSSTQLDTEKRYDVTQIRPNDGNTYPNTTNGYRDRP